MSTLFDTHPKAADFYEVCLLCNRDWGEHLGYCCTSHASLYNWSEKNDITKLPREHRFFTKSMRERLVKSRLDVAELARDVEPEKVSDGRNDDWKWFQNKAPGECPCGTNRSVCKFH